MLNRFSHVVFSGLIRLMTLFPLFLSVLLFLTDPGGTVHSPILCEESVFRLSLN